MKFIKLFTGRAAVLVEQGGEGDARGGSHGEVQRTQYEEEVAAG